jgi:hypothetical protein
MALLIVKEHISKYKKSLKKNTNIHWHGGKPMDKKKLCWIFLLRIVDSQI